MQLILIISILTFLSGILNAMQDKIVFHDPFKDDAFWSRDAWKNKYKNGDPDQGEKFLFSSTILVCFTDGFHMMKEIMISMMCMALALQQGEPIMTTVLYYAIVRGAWALGFMIVWHLILKNKV